MSEKAVKAVLDAYEIAARDGDADAYVRLFDEDVFWGPPNRAPVRSLADLRQAIGAMFGNFGLEPGFTIEHLEVSGDLASAVVHENGTITPNGGAAMTTDLTEHFVLRRRGDDWLITRQVWNSRAPAT